LSFSDGELPRVQVLNYVLEPFPWLLMTVFELSNEQQKVFEEKNPQEESGITMSWLSKSVAASSTSELSSAESDGKPKPEPKPKYKGGGKTTSGDESQGEQKQTSRKPKKKVDQQAKDAKTIQMLKDTVNRVKQEASKNKQEASKNANDAKDKEKKIISLKQELALRAIDADVPSPALSPLPKRIAASKTGEELKPKPAPAPEPAPEPVPTTQP
jgi:hypothetical protein